MADLTVFSVSFREIDIGSTRPALIIRNNLDKHNVTSLYYILSNRTINIIAKQHFLLYYFIDVMNTMSIKREKKKKGVNLR